MTIERAQGGATVFWHIHQRALEVIHVSEEYQVRWDKVLEDQAMEQLRKDRANQQPAKEAEIEWSNWRAAPQPVAVETAYHQALTKKRTYEVTINGLQSIERCL